MYGRIRHKLKLEEDVPDIGARLKEFRVSSIPSPPLWSAVHLQFSSNRWLPDAFFHEIFVFSDPVPIKDSQHYSDHPVMKHIASVIGKHVFLIANECVV